MAYISVISGILYIGAHACQHLFTHSVDIIYTDTDTERHTHTHTHTHTLTHTHSLTSLPFKATFRFITFTPKTDEMYLSTGLSIK